MNMLVERGLNEVELNRYAVDLTVSTSLIPP